MFTKKKKKEINKRILRNCYVRRVVTLHVRTIFAALVRAIFHFQFETYQMKIVVGGY